MDKRRRDLVREYKDTRRAAGVGAVRNTVSGKILLVAGVDLAALLNRNQAQLRLGAHRIAELQGDWNTLGADAFRFEVVDTLPAPEKVDYDPTEDLATLEAMWLDKLRPYGAKGYNRERKAR